MAGLVVWGANSVIGGMIGGLAASPSVVVSALAYVALFALQGAFAESLPKPPVWAGPNPEETIVYYNQLGAKAYAEMDHQSARKYFGIALAAHANRLGWGNRFALEQLVKIADTHVEEGNYAESIELVSLALEVARSISTLPINNMLVLLNYRLGKDYLKIGEFSEAYLCFKSAHELLQELRETGRFVKSDAFFNYENMEKFARQIVKNKENFVSGKGGFFIEPLPQTKLLY